MENFSSITYSNFKYKPIELIVSFLKHLHREMSKFTEILTAFHVFFFFLSIISFNRFTEVISFPCYKNISNVQSLFIDISKIFAKFRRNIFDRYSDHLIELRREFIVNTYVSLCQYICAARNRAMMTSVSTHRRIIYE